jgi:hypothetical protein
MITGIDINETPLEKKRRQSLEWLENLEYIGFFVPEFIIKAVKNWNPQKQTKK